MIVTFVRIEPDALPRRIESTNLRLSGGIVSDCISGSVLATRVDDSWIHEGQAYSTLKFIGGTRLLFGLSRHPWRLSETIRHLSLDSRSLFSDGKAIASYIEKRDMWRAAARPIWWHSLHVLDAGTFAPEIERLPDLHLWSLQTDAAVNTLTASSVN
jgi:hypothetical protein